MAADRCQNQLAGPIGSRQRGAVSKPITVSEVVRGRDRSGNLVESFGTLQNLLATTAADLYSVDGIGEVWSRHIREGLSRLAEAGIAERFS